jgi:hypothetical protein
MLGLEDATQDSYDRYGASSRPSDHESSPGNPTKRKFFNFNRSNNGSNMNSNDKRINNNGIIASSSKDNSLAQSSTFSASSSNSSNTHSKSSGALPTKLSGPPKSSGKFTFRRRSLNANPEISRLRSQIAAKEVRSSSAFGNTLLMFYFTITFFLHNY